MGERGEETISGERTIIKGRGDIRARVIVTYLFAVCLLFQIEIMIRASSFGPVFFMPFAFSLCLCVFVWKEKCFKMENECIEFKGLLWTFKARTDEITEIQYVRSLEKFFDIEKLIISTDKTKVEILGNGLCLECKTVCDIFEVLTKCPNLPKIKKQIIDNNPGPFLTSDDLP